MTEAAGQPPAAATRSEIAGQKYTLSMLKYLGSLLCVPYV